jgi:GNAT superfamily N-acetyltransferase
MTSPSEVVIREATAENLPALRELWERLYAHQQLHGMLAELATDGFELWTQALSRVIGRFACVLIADCAGAPVGFLAGRVRTPTPPFRSDPVGFISEVYVDEAHRGGGAGRLLVESAKEWFRRQGIHRIELQVLAGNTAAREAYRRWGWQEELVQMVTTTVPRPD